MRKAGEEHQKLYQRTQLQKDMLRQNIVAEGNSGNYMAIIGQYG